MKKLNLFQLLLIIDEFYILIPDSWLSFKTNKQKKRNLSLSIKMYEDLYIEIIRAFKYVFTLGWYWQNQFVNDLYFNWFKEN